jgi:hypothetical protein
VVTVIGAAVVATATAAVGVATHSSAASAADDPTTIGSGELLAPAQAGDPLAGTLVLSGSPRRTLTAPARTASSG